MANDPLSSLLNNGSEFLKLDTLKLVKNQEQGSQTQTCLSWSDLPMAHQYDTEYAPPLVMASSTLLPSALPISKQIVIPTKIKYDFDCFHTSSLSIDSPNTERICCECEPNSSKTTENERNKATRDTVNNTFKRRNSFNHSVTMKKKVSFSPVLEIRIHDVILGDHPCCYDGLPLGLSWDHLETKLVNLDHYERAQSPKRRPFQLRLTFWERFRLLESISGLTEKQMIERTEARLFFANRNKSNLSGRPF